MATMVWRCDKCKTSYESAVAAEECEQEHPALADYVIKRCTYRDSGTTQPITRKNAHAMAQSLFVETRLDDFILGALYELKSDTLHFVGRRKT